jgi:protein-disulfide isomerase
VPWKMSRLGLRSVSPIAILLVLPVWAVEGSASSIAARVDRNEISIAAVDAMSIDEARRIRVRLMEVARHAVQDLIDGRLGIEQGSESAVARKREEIYRARGVKLTLPYPEALETKLAPDQVVALIGSEPIRAAALEEAAALRLYRLRGEIYLQRRRDLNVLIERRLLQLEAQSRGVLPEELEATLSRSDPVTDAEVAAFVSRERAAGRPVDNPERVRPYLEFQKSHQLRLSVLQARRARTHIEIYLQAPERPHLAVETDGGVPLGPANGQVLVVYTNYSCALCRATHLQIDRLLAGTPAPRIFLRDFVHDSVAMEAAALVRCASRNAQAAAVRRLLLRGEPPPVGQSWLTADRLQSVARLAGMSPSALRECVSSDEVRRQIEQDTQSAHRLGFDDPPAFVAAGVPLSGMQTAELLRDVLSGRSDSELLSPGS